MKALTLTEPWATLMMLQAKRIETRSWRLPNYIIGQEVAIHSAKGYPLWAKDVRNCRKAIGILGTVEPDHNRGKVLCVVKFIGCRFTEDVRKQVSDAELCFGNYEDGRFAWFTEFIKVLEPTLAVGHLGFWDWEAPTRP